MQILFLTSELLGFVKTGGLADVAKSLPLELQKRGHDITIALPCYSKIQGYFNYPVIKELTLTNPQNNISIPFLVREAMLDGQIKVWLIDYAHYFNRNNLYAENNEAYPDNGERFAFFSAATLLTAQSLNYAPDIIHCNDWHTALTPMILKLKYTNEPLFAKTKTILTIHNGAFQGIFDRSQTWMLPEISRVSNDSVVHGYSNLNYLKCGVYYADKINAVSPSYAEELTTFLGGHGMAQNYIDRIDDLCGIVNGCDYDDWNPETDPNIPFTFSCDNFDNKILCKYLLQEICGLPVSNAPVIGMVCRITEQKGLNILIPILNELLEHKVQLIIVGTGDPNIENNLRTLSNKFSRKLSFTNSYDNNLAHLVESGSDFFLMPSIFEPCGLNQMYSLAYGTIPIVRQVGGLKDTIISYDDDPVNATGFMFNEPDPKVLLTCIRKALMFYLQEYDKYLSIRRNAMKTKYYWSESAMEYEIMYESAAIK